MSSSANSQEEENARCHLSLDKRIVKHFKSKRELSLILIALGIGLILIFFGGGGDAEPVSGSQGIEERIAEACSGVEGVGECAVYVYYSDADTRGGESVESVLVVCEGADSVEVRLRLTKILSSFFGIGSNRISVEKMRS